LKDRGLTYVRTLKSNRFGILWEFLATRSREVGSSLPGSLKDMVLTFHVPRKGKSVIPVSSVHCKNYN
jgi:hypothetical protein